MNINYSIKIDALKTIPEVSGLVNFVNIVWFTVTATNEKGTVGDCSLGAHFQFNQDHSEFTQFENLTEEQVLQWIEKDIEEAKRIANIVIARKEEATNLSNLPIDKEIPWAILENT